MVTIGSGDLDDININTKGSPVINILIELSNGVYGHVSILGGVEVPFLRLLFTIVSGDLVAININTKGSPVINIIIELSNGVYGQVPILGALKGPFLTALGYYC